MKRDDKMYSRARRILKELDQAYMREHNIHDYVQSNRLDFYYWYDELFQEAVNKLFVETDKYRVEQIMILQGLVSGYTVIRQDDDRLISMQNEAVDDYLLEHR